MLTLAGDHRDRGVLADSTATVIGAMIIAPLGTPILGIALGIVTGHLSLVLRSILWVLIGLVIVVVPRARSSRSSSPTPKSLETNSQMLGRTSPHLLDLVAALATGFAGGVRDVPQGPERRAARASRSRSRSSRRSASSACASGRGCGPTRSARSSCSSRTSSRSSSPAASSSRSRGYARDPELVAGRQPPPRVHRRHGARAHRRDAARRQLDRLGRARAVVGRRSSRPRPTGSTDAEGARVDDVALAAASRRRSTSPTDDGACPDTDDARGVARGASRRSSTVVVDVGARRRDVRCAERSAASSREIRRSCRDRGLGLVAVRRVPGAGDDRHRDERVRGDDLVRRGLPRKIE